MDAMTIYCPVERLHVDTLLDNLEAMKMKRIKRTSDPTEVSFTDGENDLTALYDPDGRVFGFMWTIPENGSAIRMIRIMAETFGMPIVQASNAQTKWKIGKDEYDRLVDELRAYSRGESSLVELGWPKILWVPEVARLFANDPSLLELSNRWKLYDELLLCMNVEFEAEPSVQ